MKDFKIQDGNLADILRYSAGIQQLYFKSRDDPVFAGIDVYNLCIAILRTIFVLRMSNQERCCRDEELGLAINKIISEMNPETTNHAPIRSCVFKVLTNNMTSNIDGESETSFVALCSVIPENGGTYRYDLTPEGEIFLLSSRYLVKTSKERFNIENLLAQMYMELEDFESAINSIEKIRIDLQNSMVNSVKAVADYKSNLISLDEALRIIELEADFREYAKNKLAERQDIHDKAYNLDGIDGEGGLTRDTLIREIASLYRAFCDACQSVSKNQDELMKYTWFNNFEYGGANVDSLNLFSSFISTKGALNFMVDDFMRSLFGYPDEFICEKDITDLGKVIRAKDPVKAVVESESSISEQPGPAPGYPDVTAISEILGWIRENAKAGISLSKILDRAESGNLPAFYVARLLLGFNISRKFQEKYGGELLQACDKTFSTKTVFGDDMIFRMDVPENINSISLAGIKEN